MLDRPLGVPHSTLIMGTDVTHSGKGADPGCPSLAAVVCGMAGPKHTEHTYLASARLQSNNTEVCQHKLNSHQF